MADTNKNDTETTKEVKEVLDPMEEPVTIRLPLTKENEADLFVRVNQRTWLIKRGETVTIPRCAVEVIEHSEEALRESIEYQRKKAKG